MICRAVSLGVFVLALFSFAPLCSDAQETGAEKEVQQMVGESYLYAIDFLFFKRLAEGELRLSETEQPGTYRAELIGRTLGVASWLSGDRTQTYTSIMELTPDGSLRSVEHTSRIVKRKWGKWKDRRRHHRYDYTQGIVFEEKYKEGAVSSRKERKIPDGQQPVDMLTAFYNLRAGVYGPLVRGAQFLIPTYSGKGFSDITVEVLPVAQQAKQKFFPTYGLLLSVTLDPEVFDTDSGNLYFWLNDAGFPERGIVEDIIGMGDARGYLVEEDL
jgi:hypothetical protein